MSNRQAQAWEATKRLGSQTAAGREMGISQGAVALLLTRYMESHGISGRRPGAVSRGGRKAGWHRGQPPTDKQQEAWEAYLETGSMQTAARLLGVTSGTVSGRVKGYLQRTGQEDKLGSPAAGRKSYVMLQAEIKSLRFRLGEAKRDAKFFEGELEKLRVRALTSNRIESKIDRLLALREERIA